MTRVMTSSGRATTYFTFHNHTHFSTLDGFSFPEEYLKRCYDLGIDGFGVSEHGNAYSFPYFDILKKKYPEVKMVYGVEFYETNDITVKDSENRYYHLICLAKDEQGRIGLNELITKSNFEGFYYKPRIEIQDIAKYADHLIVSSACLASRLAQTENYDKCVEYVNEYKALFPHFYLEAQSHKHPHQIEYNRKIIRLAEDTNTPFVITTDSHASTKEELKYQGYHVGIAKDMDTSNEIYEGCYVQSVDEIYETMIEQIGEDNVTKGLLETLNVLDLIEEVNMPFQEPKLPNIKFENQTPNEKMWEVVWGGFKERDIEKKYPSQVKEYKDRVEYEMSVISQMGFESYFLIIWDFIKYAKENKMPVGDARGSAGGSLVAFLMGITNIDPIKYGLIFERFINPERISYPDIDSDFCDQQAIISYLEEKYGKEKVCRVINFSYITPKVAVKDVGDVLNIPYKIREEVSKMFPSSDFYADYESNKAKINKYIESNSEYQEWFEIASKISGRIRQTSIHACALGVVDSKVTEYMPMQKGENGEQVIQVDMKNLEKLGIVKMDILGIKTLDVVRNTLLMIGKDMDYLDINNDDFLNNQKAYDILASGNTDGLFQVESYGMKELFKQINARNIDEVSAGISLYRPDAMSSLQNYIEYKNGTKNPSYVHPDMEPILSPQYHCMIYQEQLLDIVRKFGGRSYGGADLFRKAIGKKIIELVKEEAKKLKGEIVANGYKEDIAEIISSDMAELGGYLFNKSHGVGYATLVYKTAFLKANHPVEYMTALLNSEIGNFEAMSKYIVNCKQMGIEVSPPNINRSEKHFTCKDGKILFGLNMIKGVGDSATDTIFKQRPFSGYDDFLNKCLNGEKKVDKTAMVALIKAGAVGKNKSKLLQQYCDYTFESREFSPLKTLGSTKVSELESKYGIVTKDKEERMRLFNIEKEKEFNINQKARLDKHRNEFIEKYMQTPDKWEFDTLSIYLTQNPFEKSLQYITEYDNIEDGDNTTIIGTVVSITKKKGKAGQYAFMEFYNGLKNIELIFWTGVYAKYMDKIKKGTDLAVIGTKEGDKVTVHSCKPYVSWVKEKKLT